MATTSHKPTSSLASSDASIKAPTTSPFADPHLQPSAVHEHGRLATETLLAGPFSFFHGSMQLEFLQPDGTRDASVLMRTTYKAGHPLCRLGRKYPQSPPLHLHFAQAEHFQVVRGSVGVTRGWGRQYRHEIVRVRDGAGVTPAWEPHSIWPDPDAREDGVTLIWAGPRAVGHPLDHVFFYNLLCLFSDAYERGARPHLLQAALTQYETGTAVVWLPRQSWLGPLRWMLPFAVEAVMACVARLAGMKPFMAKYTTDAQIDMIRQLKKSKNVWKD